MASQTWAYINNDRNGIFIRKAFTTMERNLLE